MESAFLDALIKLGSTGLVAGVLWIIAKRFMDETVTQMSSRIDSLEKRSEACEKDRSTIHTQMIAILQDARCPHKSEQR